MAKDHRPKKSPPFKFAPDGVVEANPPPASNPMPPAPSPYADLGMKQLLHDSPEKRKQWDAYWESVQSEFDAWNMHYKRTKWER